MQRSNYRVRHRATLSLGPPVSTRSLLPQLPILGTERILLLRVELQRPRSGLSNLGGAQLHRGLHGRRYYPGHRG